MWGGFQMLKVVASIATSVLVATALTTAASAKSRAISTDTSVAQTELDVPANSVAHLVFLSAAGTGQTYTGGGTRSDFLSINAGTQASPASGTPIFCSGTFGSCTTTAAGTNVVLGSSPLNLVLTTQNDTGGTVVLPLDSFFGDNSLTSANPIKDESGFNAGNTEQSGQIFIDQVQATNNFGVPTPGNLAALLSAPGVFDVQYLGWQDNNPPTSAFADANVDPWTYNNMVVAVYFTPLGSTGGGGLPEPAAWSMLLLGFFGLGATVRRTRRAYASTAV
jgi:hypothetical protein